MHVAEQLQAKNLKIALNGCSASCDQLFPNTHKYDRFGFIINEPFGSLGASLLIQAGIVQFYDAVPERRTTKPMYPEIYMFHVGGRHGDHSSFDFWPPRKEVFMDGSDPAEVLAALVDRGITRLAIPDAEGGNADLLREGPSTWADLSAAENLFSTCFAYSASGQTKDADVVLESEHPSFEANPASTLDAHSVLKLYEETPDVIPRPGPTIGVDVDRWADHLVRRADEIDPRIPQQLASQRLQHVNGRDIRRESLRRVDLEETFRLLSCL